MKISFVWQGSSDKHTFQHWNDGLREAMRHIEKKHKVEYVEPYDPLTGDVVLYWEAPITAQGKHKEWYNQVRYVDKPKIMLFAGGEVRDEWCDGFDMFLVESEINEEDFDRIGRPWMRAFGVNERLFKPENLEKKYDAFFQATFAGWKRHELFADAMGERGLCAGRRQEHDLNGYNRCVEKGVQILPEQSVADVAKLINQSHTVLNTSEFWGGGQRTTLEAMACNVPPIVMADSPKNREYVEESGFGVVCDPDPIKIREAVDDAKKITNSQGREYIMSKWTSKHYADQIMKAIAQCAIPY